MPTLCKYSQQRRSYKQQLTLVSLEVIRARYGPVTHGVYILFGLMTNVLVTAMLLTGGSAVVTSLCGVPTAAACFLLPIGVVLYTMFGGIKATFLTDYVHTVVILVSKVKGQRHPNAGCQLTTFFPKRRQTLPM